MSESFIWMDVVNFLVGFACLWVLYRCLLGCIACHLRRKMIHRVTDETWTAWTELRRKLTTAKDRIASAKRISSTASLTKWCRKHLSFDQAKVRQRPEDLLTIVIQLTASGGTSFIGQVDQHIRKIEKGWRDLMEWATLATQAGLLGTVVGIIQAFAKLGDGGNPISTLGSLSFCLWTTVFGLVAAILLRLVLHFYLKPSLDEFIAVTDEAVLDLSLRAAELRTLVESRVEKGNRCKPRTRAKKVSRDRSNGRTSQQKPENSLCIPIDED